MELVYETHAITTDNEAGIATGWLPGKLSEAGRRTAAELGDRRRNDGIVAVYTSDLLRAMETARIAFDGTSMPIHHDPRLRECNYGRLNGMPRDRLDLERVRHLDEPWPGGESYAEVVARTRAILAYLLRQWDGARILVIAHSANQWALDHLLLGADMAERIEAGMTWQPGWEYVLGWDVLG